MRTPHLSQRGTGDSYLQGQLLIAMPSMTDPRFRRSVIYMCAHSSEGAMGLIVNQRAERVSLKDLLQQLRLLKKDAEMPEHLDRPVQIGGPVSAERGHVLHTDDYFAKDSTVAVADGVCLTRTLDILRSIVEGRGPAQSLLALGYAGWSAGQLEQEIQANGWLHCTADHELVFGTDLEQKYERAIAKLGIDLSHLVSDAGHA